MLAVCAKGDGVMDERGRAGDGRERGFALILAILALMLLTFLGLTLATSTSQELQIATNYRWNQQALYNAEAGIDVGKALLRDIEWQNILPTERGTSWTMNDGTSAASPVVSTCVNCALATQDSEGRNLRNLENAPCDAYGGATGFGVVLVDDDGKPYQYVTNVFGQSVNGAFTIWVRRKIEVADGVLKDVADPEELIMTVEGIAPYRSSQADSAISKANRAVKYLEFTVAREDQDDPSICGTRAGQAGAGPEGANFGGCVAMDADRVAEGLGTSATLVEDTDAE